MTTTHPLPELDPSLAGALPADFHWGFATAAAQVEGAWDRDGKGPSIWDMWCHPQEPEPGEQRGPERIKDGSTNEDAVRSYDLYAHDVARMKAYGVTAYRFSLAWSRIIPLGGRDDPVNESGLAYYDRLVDALLANGITPFVTLFHWDPPQALEDRYGGLRDPARYTPDFVRYARVCFARLGDRVRHWTTYNEPGVYALAGYAAGVHAPGRSSFRELNARGDSSTEPFLVGHTQLVSHGHVCRLYRDEFQPAQGGTVMITLHGNWAEPWDAADPRDVAAAQRANEFEIAWFADPLYGPGDVADMDYPASMRAQLGDRLPRFTDEEKRLVRGSSEAYGMNSYTAFYVRNRGDRPADVNDHKGNVEILDTDKAGRSRGLESDTPWLRTAEWGWAKLLRWVWGRYHTPIFITENGTTARGEHEWTPRGTDDVLEDPHRIDFFHKYVTAVARAARDDGVVVKSYFAWTFTDNWEWSAGFSDRFGVTWVDFASPDKTRYAKRSAYFLRDLFAHLIKKE